MSGQFLMVLLGVDIPAALENPVRMAIARVILNQWLNSDVAPVVAIPIRGKTAGLGIVAVFTGLEGKVLTVQRIGLPTGIGAVLIRIDFEHP